MEKTRLKKSVPGAVLLTTGIVIGGFVVSGLRGNAGQPSPQTPPVQPPVQALQIETAFEQVADKLRPSVVFIKSRQAATQPGMFRNGGWQENQDGGDVPNPFDLFPGLPRGNGQFRMIPPSGGMGAPAFPHHAFASGSGVVVRSDGYILTNDHVVNGADRVTVRLQDGREFVGEVKRDFRSDLALIKIAATNLSAAQLADSDKTKVGQYAIAFGSPFGLSDTMTVGVVSALHREQQIGGGSDARLYSSLIQTDASINPGNSGGALVDIYGRVVGINVAIESPSGGNVGIGFAIPSNTARYVMEQLITRGSVTRGFLGLSPKTLSYVQKQSYGTQEGALVSSVQDGTPASKAGFEVQDVILKFNGKNVEDEAHLRDMVARTKPGESVPVEIRRGNDNRTLQVTVGTAPDLQAVAKEVSPKATARGKLGVTVGNASDADVRKQFSLKDEVKTGAVIVEVIPGSPAFEAGLQPGDIISRVNGKPITNADQLTAAAASLKEGESATVVIKRGNTTILADITLE